MSEKAYSGWDTATQPLSEWLGMQEVVFLRGWYETLDPEMLDPSIQWHNADGSPYGGTFVGPQALMEGYFAPLRRDFADWRATIEEVIGSGSIGYVIVRGQFHGRAKATGIEIMVPFANFWRVHGGKLISVQQYTDTRILADALAGKAPRSNAA
jgi:ketosteroid isomerase-like protein